MTIQDVKAELKIVNPLTFDFPKDSEGNTTTTEWVRAWDNLTRTDVHMHVETDDKLKASNGTLSTLSIQELTLRDGKQGEYTFVRLVIRENNGRSQY